ncbi:hypothetical protein [Moritella sp. F3]|uniref:hypothetical protein n=1 Tax=Moritella sp. F3 TaxID=2718882 RepID=UPI0018E1208E|nr:hypothetical protein [Moritella sp. F3]GIC77183.1 hypothetical protein FMO001_19100 [Moritella sp. F1]GIC82302.1 hypothetical protein FMO003_25830 [Moritella sp. F3]
MLDRILKLYWTPKGTSFWKANLLSVLIGSVLLALWVLTGIVPADYAIGIFILVVLVQLLLATCARYHYGHVNPNKNRLLKMGNLE